MAIKDIRSNLMVLLALSAAISTNTTTNGAIIDTKNHDLGLMFAANVTAFTDGSYVVQAFESDASDMTGEVQITGNKLIGTPPTLTAVTASGAAMSTFGVISNLRYVRLKVVSTGVTTGATLRLSCIQAAELCPVA